LSSSWFVGGIDGHHQRQGQGGAVVRVARGTRQEENDEIDKKLYNLESSK
jgi:hypothetical protein